MKCISLKAYLFQPIHHRNEESLGFGGLAVHFDAGLNAIESTPIADNGIHFLQIGRDFHKGLQTLKDRRHRRQRQRRALGSHLFNSTLESNSQTIQWLKTKENICQ